MIEIFSAGCGRRNSARRALPGESVGRKGWLGPLGLLRAAARTCWVCPAGRVGGAERLVGPFGFLRAAARTCWACPAGRVGGVERLVRPFGFLRAAARTCWVCPAGRVGGVERLVGPFGPFAGCCPDLLGVPCRASRLGGKVSWALWVFLRAAARTCWACPTGRVRWTERFVGPFGGLRIGASIRLCT